MHRTWFRCLLFVALATSSLALHSGAAVAASKSAAAPTAKAKNSLHQFTGVVTALDKQSLTVEKGGKKPATRTFARHEDMSVTGDLTKESRVTVYYRDEGGKSVARKVVVKAASGATAAR